MSSLLLLVLELVVLRLAQNICSSLVRFLITAVLSLTVQRVVNWFVQLSVRKEVRVIPHVRVRVVAIILPSLSIDVAYFLLIVHGIIPFRCDI